MIIMLMVLGVVQGIAEFLPISSSGHLVILEQLPVVKNILTFYGGASNLFINVALHVATLLAVVFYLRKDIQALIVESVKGLFSGDFTRAELKIAFYIIIATIPAVVIGLLFNDFFEQLYASSSAVFFMLIINGFILISTKKIPAKDRKLEEIGIIRSVVIGFCQAVAIIPGMSRSGMTITGGLMSGLQPTESARFSFLMAVPVIAGAGVYEGMKITKGTISGDMIAPLIVSMIITFVIALFSIKILFALVRQIKIDIFGYYTIALGSAGLLLLYLQ